MVKGGPANTSHAHGYHWSNKLPHIPRDTGALRAMPMDESVQINTGHMMLGPTGSPQDNLGKTSYPTQWYTTGHAYG